MEPECILNTSASNSFTNHNNNEFPTISDNDDPFPAEDDNIIEDILSQMPHFSPEISDFSPGIVDTLIPSSQTISRLSGDALKRVCHNIYCFINFNIGFMAISTT